MWTRLTPDQAAGLYRVAPQTATEAASEYYESALQPRTAPGHDGPWSLLRVRRHADAPGVLTWQIANIEPEQLDWPAFDPLAGASSFLLLTCARLAPLLFVGLLGGVLQASPADKSAAPAEKPAPASTPAGVVMTAADVGAFLEGLVPTQLAREDIAGAVLYLVDAEFVTGSTLFVDGGRMLNP